MSWEEAKKLALLGTDRARLPERLRKTLRALGVEEGSEGQMLLQALTLFRQMERAGQPLRTGTDQNIPHQKVTPAYRKAPARLLERLLHEAQQEVLPEALSLLQDYEVKVPNEFLPELMSWLSEHPGQWEAVRDTLDERAHHLIARNPNWKQFALSINEDAWYYGNPADRRQWLVTLRQKSPREALAYLQESWEKEHPQDKCRFLSVFKKAPHAVEEPFLAQALTDSQKEVRQMAAKMLAIRPDHPYRHHLFAKATQYLTREEEGTLQVEVPAGYDEEFAALGIGYRRKNVSAKQARRWVWDMVRLIPPAFWETWCRRKTYRALRLFAVAEDRPFLLEALVEATVLHRDEQWMGAILRLALREEEDLLTTAPGQKLLRALPAHVFNEVMVAHLQDQPNAPLLGGLARQVLLIGEQPWSEALTRAVIRPFREGLSGSSWLYGWEWEGYQPVMDQLALRCPPEMLDELRQGWNRAAGSWGMWEKRIDRLLKTVHFRQGMHRYFAKEYASDA